MLRRSAIKFAVATLLVCLVGPAGAERKSLRDCVTLWVVAKDRYTAERLVAHLRDARQAGGLSSYQMVKSISGDPKDIFAGDLQRLGFTNEALPCFAAVKISSSGNPEKIVGSPQIIVRRVSAGDPGLSARLVVARLAQNSGHSGGLPPEYRQLLEVFRPQGYTCVIVDKTKTGSDALLQKTRELANKANVTPYDLPMLAADLNTFDASTYERLGFGVDSLPCVCLVRNSPEGNPSSVVPNTLVRNIGNVDFAAQDFLSRWGKWKGVNIASSGAAGFDCAELQFVDEQGRPKTDGQYATGDTIYYQYRPKGFTPGRNNQGWVQENRQVRSVANSTMIGYLEDTHDYRQDYTPDGFVVRSKVQLINEMQDGNYEIQLAISDKVATKTQRLTLPFRYENRGKIPISEVSILDESGNLRPESKFSVGDRVMVAFRLADNKHSGLAGTAAIMGPNGVVVSAPANLEPGIGQMRVTLPPIPDSVTAGDYQVKISLLDQKDNKKGSSSASIRLQEYKKLIKASAYTPTNLGRPLKSGELITATVQGVAGATATLTIGSSTVPLFEMAPGFYQAQYSVSIRDNGDIPLKVVFNSADGFTEKKDLGSVTVEGMGKASVNRVQSNGGNFVCFGSAPPGSQVIVKVHVDMGRTLLFGIPDVDREANVTADSNGNFQFNLQFNSDARTRSDHPASFRTRASVSNVWSEEVETTINLNF